jgi:hypothetical protein
MPHSAARRLPANWHALPHAVPRMSASQEHITNATPMGANIVPGGATFRVFAPSARAMYINGIFDGVDFFRRDADDSLLLVKKNNYWTGFVSNVKDGDQYLFFVVGNGFKDFKRDPYARELSTPGNFPGSLPFPSCNCVVRDPHRYHWHDQGFRPPAFNDLVIYQLHIGTFFGAQRARGRAKFLDVLDKIDHLVRLGVNAVEPLPVDEVSEHSSGADDHRGQCQRVGRVRGASSVSTRGAKRHASLCRKFQMILRSGFCFFRCFGDVVNTQSCPGLHHRYPRHDFPGNRASFC